MSLYDDPDFYDARSLPEPYASHYASLAAESGGPVLELGCGTGQIIVPIAKGGLPSTGIDLSPVMLAAARRRAEQESAPVRFVEGDMRNFDLDERFSTVIIARNSLLQLAEVQELRACLSAIRRHLRPGGRLVFDIFSPSVQILATPPGQRRFVREFTTSRHGTVTLEMTSDYDAAAQVNRGTWHHSTVTQKDFLAVPIHLRCIFPQELPLLLELEGFELEERWGSFSREAFTSESRLQVCRARAIDSIP